MSVQRAQFEITSMGFVDWIVYLDNEETKEDYYLANIAAEIRRSYVKDPVKVDTESFLIKSGRHDSKRLKKMNVKEKTKKSKLFWSMLLGITKGNK